MQRQLRKPEDIEVSVEISAVDEEPQHGDDLPPSAAEQTMYRAVSARINFLAQDRTELLFAAKEVSRHMSAPCQGDFGPVKRIGRFFVRPPTSVTMFRWQDAPSRITADTDSNRAGCKATRKSTSGAPFLHGKHLIKAYSRTQTNIALSSAEAERYATVAAASAGRRLKAMAID